jgi:hypothetical protein
MDGPSFFENQGREKVLMLLDLRPLVEEAECKRRVEAAGFAWAHRPHSKALEDKPVGLWETCAEVGSTRWFATWPDAAAWSEAQAEAQAAKRPRWSKPISEMTRDEAKEMAISFGASRVLDRSAWCDVLRGAARDAHDPDTDRVRLPEVPA